MVGIYTPAVNILGYVVLYTDKRVTIGVRLNRYCLPDEYWKDEFYSDYGILLLLADRCYLNLVLCIFRSMFDADVKLKQTVAIFPVLAFHFLCVFRLYDLSRAASHLNPYPCRA